MHEFSLINDLLRKIEAVAARHNARKVVAVNVTIGALAHISPEHLRGHFVEAAAGTVAAGARLEVRRLTDQADPHAQDIRLENVEVEA
jgi:hydrogenase nickel incorporation protein HypA/HybF